MFLSQKMPAFSLLLWAAAAYSNPVICPVAAELRSDRFHVSIAGHETAVAHAATTYYFLSFAVKGRTRVSIAADRDDYWSKGVEVQPWRWGIRPAIQGRTITFDIPGPAKLSISRPGDHGAGAEMLFLFADPPETDVPRRDDPHLHYYGPGTYRENLNPKSGDTIYLAPGAVVFGALNLWGVENVKVFGRGAIVYDGPQNPAHDEGWMHKPDWHVIVMDHARHIRISGITCIVRSRTWMIQMLGSRDVQFDNVKVIGGCAGNANQDGMDWLGGGDAVIRNSFFRASDDIFALYGNWLGYDTASQTTPGETVSNITVEDSVLSTSVSNVVRVSWPEKIFDSHHFTIRNSDVIHMGMGGCKVPFGLLEIWDDPGGKGLHEDYSFENIRLEEWYSLAQLRQQSPGIRNVRFKNMWALETPSLSSSVLSGDVRGVALQNVSIAGSVARADRDVPLRRESNASAPVYSASDGPHASFRTKPGVVQPGTRVTLDASASTGEVKKYEWLFGDGTTGHGRVAHHSFPDSKGTLLESSGRFRVLLKVTDAKGREDWTYEPVLVTGSYLPAVASAADMSFRYQYYEGAGLHVGDLSKIEPTTSGKVQELTTADRKRAENYAFVFDGFMNAPVDGGYTFLLRGSDEGELLIDGRLIAASPSPKPQVCGMRGNMVQMATVSIGLRAGKHTIHVAMTHAEGPDEFAVTWRCPARKQ